MHRQDILDLMDSYEKNILPAFILNSHLDASRELETLKKFRNFINETPSCFERETAEGHITGSALVVSKDLNRSVLTLHKKLNLWLQLGGHADGHSDIKDVAMREVEEESGITDISFFNHPLQPQDEVIPFDFDIHLIPAHKDEPEHYHYDIRFIIVAHDNKLSISEESHDLKWFDFDEAKITTKEMSMHRQFDKFLYLRSLS